MRHFVKNRKYVHRFLRWEIDVNHNNEGDSLMSKRLQYFLDREPMQILRPSENSTQNPDKMTSDGSGWIRYVNWLEFLTSTIGEPFLWHFDILQDSKAYKLRYSDESNAGVS